MAEQIEKVAPHAVVVVGGGVDDAFALVTEIAVGRELPLAVVEAAAARPREGAAALADLGVVKNFALVRDEGGVEVVVRHARKVELVLRAVAGTADGVPVILRDHEALGAQIRRDVAVVDDIQGRAVEGEFRLGGRDPASAGRFDVELHDRIVVLILCQSGGIDAVAGGLIAASASVVAHGEIQPGTIGAVVVEAVDEVYGRPPCGRRAADARGDGHRV